MRSRGKAVEAVWGKCGHSQHLMNETSPSQGEQGGVLCWQEENRGLGLKYHMNRKLGSSSPHQCLAPSFLRDDASDPSTTHLSSCTSRRCTSAVSVSIR
jgi:hypothetical protein